MSGIDLSQLTPPDVIESLDYETLLAERKARLISLYPADEQATIAAVLQLESEPMVRMLQEGCYRELILRARYNDEARAVMLAYAVGSNLDHIGVTYYQEERLLVSAEDLDAVPPVAAVYETDADYRARLASKPESYSTAGPAGAYVWHAKSAAAEVLDAFCDSPEPGTSRITVLSRTGNGVPSAGLLATVFSALSADSVRPLCEEVLVQAADVAEYAITATLYVLPGPDASVVRTEAIAALQTYADSRHLLGYDVTLSGLYAAAHRAGVQRAVITSPAADIVRTGLQAAYCTGITVTLAGVDQ